MKRASNCRALLRLRSRLRWKASARQAGQVCGATSLIIMAALAVTAALPARADTVRWLTSSGTNDWFAGANWDSGAAPAAGDDVIITNANVGVLLTNSTAALSSILLSNRCTLVFSNWNTSLSATNVMILTNGVMTLPAAFTNTAMSNRVWVVCSNLTIAAGGSINVNAKGYWKGGSVAGHGPGGGSYGGAGGAHGGSGGLNTAVTYGTISAPLFAGSSGGGTPWSSGGAGGGAVRIEASGTVLINGTIAADGGNTGVRAGGGSGGSIFIECNTIQGTNGTVTADGGLSTPYDYSGGGGGGGRIAIVYNPAAQDIVTLPSLVFSVAGGRDGAVPSSELFGRGDIGTLYFPDNRFFTHVMSHRGQWLVPGLTNIAVDSLIFSNAWIRLPPAFQIVVTNDFVLRGDGSSWRDRGRLELTGDVLHCGGNLVLTNSGSLHLISSGAVPVSATIGSDLRLSSANTRMFVWSTATNAMNPDYGALIDVAGMLYVASNAWIYPYSQSANGGSPFFKMGDLAIDAMGGINANGMGYQGGAAVFNGHGYGPGRGLYASGGGGYGGAGGGVNGGVTCGSSNAPIDQGSGGASRFVAGGVYVSGGHGGGAVRVKAAGAVTLDGTITANGNNGATAYAYRGGGGSGGGIYLSCHAFRGGVNGLLQANGGIGAATDGPSGGGGGGRIAVWRISDVGDGTITTSVSAGSGASPAAEDGTVVWGWLPPRGTVISFH